MRVRGPHGVAVDAFGGDLLAASAFDGVIEAKDDDTAGDEHGHEEPEEQPTGGERRPDGAIAGHDDTSESRALHCVP